jgi:hypothetical protein
MVNQRIWDSGLKVWLKPIKIYAHDGTNFGPFPKYTGASM